MDLYDDNRTLVYESMVARRGRSDAGFSTWLDQNLALLDNYRACRYSSNDKPSLQCSQS